MSEERFSHLVNTKLGLVLEKQVSTTPALMRDSVSYTLQARLAPAWNKVGDWLLQGRQFLHASNPIEAVEMKVHVADDCVEIALKATVVMFPLMTVLRLL